MKIEVETRKRIFRLTPPLVLLLALPILCVVVDFYWGIKIQYFTNFRSVNTTLDEEQEFIKYHLTRLKLISVKTGDDRSTLDATGFACDETLHSIVCVSTENAIVNTHNMTVYTPHHLPHKQTVIRPYARQEQQLKDISPVHVIAGTPPPSCQYNHTVPAVIFSSGSTGNAFHEINEIVIPLFITTKHFRSRVFFILEDYNPSFVAKYGKVLSHLSAHEAMNPTQNQSVHCFPGFILGLKYHDNLFLNATEIPGGYGMPEFRTFLRRAYGLRFGHVSQMTKPKPRLMLLSRTSTRRFLNEEEMVKVMETLGFQVIVVRRSKVISNLNVFSRMINSCSVLVGVHGAGLTNEIFLPSGGAMVQVELLGTEWASRTYYGDTARAMDVRYLRYKIRGGESSLSKVYGANHSVVTDPGSVYRDRGYRAGRALFLDQQNVRIDLGRFRETLVEALSIVTADWEPK